MAKINTESREIYGMKCEPYKSMINESLEKEKNMLALIEKDKTGNAYKRLLLCDEMIYVSTLYMAMNSLSVTLLSTKNNDALNDARKTLYKAIIYLEDIVTNVVDVQYSEIEDKVEQIKNTPLSKRYELIRKLGLAIRLLIDAFGENSKWFWSFVELRGRFATVAKNILDWKQGTKDYFDSQSPDYDTTVYFIRLIKKLIDDSAADYRNRYEKSTHRQDDMRLAINYLVASRRICVIIGNSEEAEEIKKKALVWREKMETDRKKGLSK